MPFFKNETGISVCRRMECFLIDSGLPVLFAEVYDVKKTLEGLVKLRTSEGDIITRYALFATGRMPVKYEKESKRIKYFHDEIKEGETAVIGGGEVAVSQAISLKQRGLTADIFTRSGLKNVNSALKREADMENIKIIHAGESLKFGESSDKVIVAYRAKDEEIILLYDNLLYSCGREPVMPQTDFNINDEHISRAGTVKKEFPSQCDDAFKDGEAEGMKIGLKLRGE
jgi:thioredoxin reductase